MVRKICTWTDSQKNRDRNSRVVERYYVFDIIKCFCMLFGIIDKKLFVS